MSTQHAIGFGASSRATCADVLALIQLSLIQLSHLQSGPPVIPPDTLLATVDRRAILGEAVAHALGLPLVLLSPAVLAQVSGTRTASAKASATLGTASVAEAAALASLGTSARLLIPRQTGRSCTFAMAVLP